MKIVAAAKMVWFVPPFSRGRTYKTACARIFSAVPKFSICTKHPVLSHTSKPQRETAFLEMRDPDDLRGRGWVIVSQITADGSCTQVDDDIASILSGGDERQVEPPSDPIPEAFEVSLNGLSESQKYMPSSNLVCSKTNERY
jgi:hypothetical protein